MCYIQVESIALGQNDSTNLYILNSRCCSLEELFGEGWGAAFDVLGTGHSIYFARKASRASKNLAKKNFDFTAAYQQADLQSNRSYPLPSTYAFLVSRDQKAWSGQV